MTKTHLMCPNCTSTIFDDRDDAVQCRGCQRTYPRLRDIIDVRDAVRDQSAGFDIAHDRLLASKLDAAFDRTTTFNELRLLYEGINRRIAAGAALETIDPFAVIREDGIVPETLSPEQLAHAPALLAKLPLYLEDSDLPPVRRGIALEDGCGEGYFVDGFAHHFAHVYVLDLSLALLLFARKIAEERGLTNVTLVCGNVERLPFAPDSFDFIHCNNVIEHVRDQAAMFAEARRTLAPTGLLFVLSPNRFSLYFEPHWGLPGFGFFPPRLRKWLVHRKSGRNVDDVALHSLQEVTTLARRAFPNHVEVSFIPRRLRDTATGGRVRALLTGAMNAKGVGRAANWMINRAALGVMPYHVLLCAKQRGAPSPPLARQ